ncbi:MAG: LPS export ABC transporter periplasmic protein LptC [Spirochaetia bacterium]
MRALRALPLAALLVGCSIDYKGASVEEQSPSGIPDTVAVGLLHRVHKDGRLSLELEAARAETWNAKNQTVLTDAHFVEFDEKGARATEGEARTVVFHSDTENAEISGSVHVHSAMEKGDVHADILDWENKTKRLTAPPAERVIVGKDDGSILVGTGFSGDFRKRQVIFTGPVRGTYVWQPK